MAGMIITFSGLDGCGKSTQMRHLQAAVRDRRERPVAVWSRLGYTPLMEGGKWLLRRCLGSRQLPPQGASTRRTVLLQKSWLARLWLIGGILDLMLVYGLYFRLLRGLGRVVVSDRYLWDSWVDILVHFPGQKRFCASFWPLLEWLAPRPDRAFFLEVPVAEALRRGGLKDDPFPVGEEALEQRLAGYRQQQQQASWELLDGTLPPNALAARILQTVYSGASR